MAKKECKDIIQPRESFGAMTWSSRLPYNRTHTWTAPLRTTGFQYVFDPTAQQRGDRVKFVRAPMECPQCGANLRNGNRQCPDCDFTRTPKARGVKLIIIRGRERRVCDECGGDLICGSTDSFGNPLHSFCSQCGLTH